MEDRTVTKPCADARGIFHRAACTVELEAPIPLQSLPDLVNVDGSALVVGERIYREVRDCDSCAELLGTAVDCHEGSHQ